MSKIGFPFIEKHFLDSLTILDEIKENESVIDVGTGAGFPGIPLAICSKANFVLVDSLSKRINFLKEVKEKINLNNIEIYHARAEEFAIFIIDHDCTIRECAKNFDISKSTRISFSNRS